MKLEEIEKLPQDVQDIINSYDEEDYEKAERIIRELAPLGYTVEYGLCGGITEIKKV